MLDVNLVPKHGWTCFHCGETFKTVDNAREHFGLDQNYNPGCIIKISPGGESSLLKSLRLAEMELEKYRLEDIAVVREMHALQSRHSEALRRAEEAEEAGYERGLSDGLKHQSDYNCDPNISGEAEAAKPK